MQVYIGTYNIAKLQNLTFSRNFGKTKLSCVAIFAIHKNVNFDSKTTQNKVFTPTMVLVIIKITFDAF